MSKLKIAQIVGIACLPMLHVKILDIVVIVPGVCLFRILVYLLNRYTVIKVK